MGQDSVVSIVTRYGLNCSEIISQWGLHFLYRYRLAFGSPSLLYNGHWVSAPGVMWPECGVDHPLPSSGEVKERIKLYLYSPSGPSWPVLGQTLPFRRQVNITYKMETSKHNLQIGEK